MLLDLEENEDSEPDKELKKILEPKVTESATTEAKEEEVDAAKKESKTLTLRISFFALMFLDSVLFLTIPFYACVYLFLS